jgi:hypothetical protein
VFEGVEGLGSGKSRVRVDGRLQVVVVLGEGSGDCVEKRRLLRLHNLQSLRLNVSVWGRHNVCEFHAKLELSRCMRQRL